MLNLQPMRGVPGAVREYARGWNDDTMQLRRHRQKPSPESLRTTWRDLPPADSPMPKLWSLIVFGHDRRQSKLLRQYTPLLRTVRVQVTPSYWNRNLANEPRYEGWEWMEWALWCVESWLRDGFNVAFQLHDDAIDIARPDYAAECVEFVEQLESRIAAIGRPLRGRVIGQLFDAEWEDKHYVADGWRGYVERIAPCVRAMRGSRHPIPLFGPGGTHPEDDTLDDVLAAMTAREARFDQCTAHMYSDWGSGGWGRGWEKRFLQLLETARQHGYPDLAITECGVSGRRGWGDDLNSGTAMQRHDTRLGSLKRRLDRDPCVRACCYYQFTEGPSERDEEYGGGFGLFVPNENALTGWDPKTAVRYFAAVV